MISDTLTPIDEQVFLAVINGYVAVPNIADNKRLTLAQALAAIPSATIQFMLGRTYYVLPSFDRSNQYPEDWFAILDAAATVL
jgi:hypothetical protein